MTRPGFFVFPRHYVNESVEFIRAFQPSVVKAFASVTSPDWWRAVQAHLQDVEAVRMDLLKRHARTDEAGELVPGEGGVATFEDGARERFIADWEALLAERVEFEYGIRVSDLGNIEVRPSVLVGLGALLEEEG